MAWHKSDYFHVLVCSVWPMRDPAKPMCTPPARCSSFNYLICDTNRCLCCIIKNSQQQWQTTMKSRKWKVISRRAHAINKVSHLPCELPAQNGEPKAEDDTHSHTHTHRHNEMGPVTVVWKYNTHNFHFLRPKNQKQKRLKLTKQRQNMAQCGVPERVERGCAGGQGCCWELSAAQHLFITSCVVICVASTSVATTTRAITITITQLIQKYDCLCV